MRPRPLPQYLAWLRTVSREDQFTSTVCLGEIYHGALRVRGSERHLDHIRRHLLPAITILPFDAAVALEYGHIRLELEGAGMPLPDADLQIAATARYHGLTLVTGNLKHFERVASLEVYPILAEAREQGGSGSPA